MNSNVNKIYVSEAIRSFALGTIQVFVPIFLLASGYSLREVVVLYVAASLTHIILAVPAGALGSRIGFKYLILAGIPFLLLFFGMLYDLRRFAWPLWFLGVIREIGLTLYWVGRHSFLGFYTDIEHIGLQVGMNNLLASLAATPAPLLGGIILAANGIKFLILVAAVGLSVSAIPLFFIKEQWRSGGFSLKDAFPAAYWRNVPVFLAQGIDNVVSADLVWPAYLLVGLGLQYAGVGLVNSLYNGLSLLSTYVVGVLSDGAAATVFRWGAVGSLFLWFLRIGANPVGAAAAGSAAGLTDTMVEIPFGVLSYRIARQGHFVRFIVFREICIHAGKIAALAVLFAIDSLRGALMMGLLYPVGYLLFGFDDISNVERPGDQAIEETGQCR